MTLLGERVSSVDIGPEQIPVGEVVEREVRRARNSSGHNYLRRRVAVGDESEPQASKGMQIVADLFEDALIKNKDWEAPSPANNYQTNPAWEWFYRHDPNQTSMLEWRELMPTAKALYPMQRLEDAARVFPSGVVDERAKEVFLNMLDCIAIRSRARVMTDHLLHIAADSPRQELTVVSLGCGAAVPDIDAANRMKETMGKTVHMKLYDLDRDALRFAEELAHEAGIPEDKVETNAGFYVRAFALPNESVDIVDVLGLWEYLPEKECVKLLQRSYDLLTPGGAIIASNMLDSRRQLKFNQHAVGWPKIYPRSEDTLVDIVAAAGLDTDQLTFTVPEDGVYGVMEIRKP